MSPHFTSKEENGRHLHKAYFAKLAQSNWPRAPAGPHLKVHDVQDSTCGEPRTVKGSQSAARDFPAHPPQVHLRNAEAHITKLSGNDLVADFLNNNPV